MISPGGGIGVHSCSVVLVAYPPYLFFWALLPLVCGFYIWAKSDRFIAQHIPAARGSCYGGREREGGENEDQVRQKEMKCFDLGTWVSNTG